MPLDSSYTFFSSCKKTMPSEASSRSGNFTMNVFSNILSISPNRCLHPVMNFPLHWGQCFSMLSSQISKKCLCNPFCFCSQEQAEGVEWPVCQHLMHCYNHCKPWSQVLAVSKIFSEIFIMSMYFPYILQNISYTVK